MRKQRREREREEDIQRENKRQNQYCEYYKKKANNRERGEIKKAQYK